MITPNIIQISAVPFTGVDEGGNACTNFRIYALADDNSIYQMNETLGVLSEWKKLPPNNHLTAPKPPVK